jgi:hypothetical protein
MMVDSKRLRDALAIGLSTLFVFAAGARAESSSEPTGDELLQMVPAESLFCVRVNNLNHTLSQLDQFLIGLSPKPMAASTLVRTQFAKALGSPDSDGVNMNGSFVIFGVTADGESPRPKLSNIFIGVLAPVTDYSQFMRGNPNVGQPDEHGISKIASEHMHALLAIQVKDYVLIGLRGNENELIATAKSILAGNARGLAGTLDAAELRRATEERIWAYGNVQLASEAFGPMLLDRIQQMKRIMEGTETRTRTKVDPFEMLECSLADTNSDKELTIDELDQQMEKLKAEMETMQRSMQARIERLEQRKARPAPTRSDREAYLDALEQQIEKLKKMKDQRTSDMQQRIDRLARLKDRLVSMGPDRKVKIRELVRQTVEVKEQPNKTRDPQVSEALANAMDMYAAVLERLMKEIRSLSLTVAPKPSVCNLTLSVSAMPGTDMADMFVADATAAEENTLLGYLEDGAAMNLGWKMDTPFWKRLSVESLDLAAALADESMPAENIEEIKALVVDMVGALGGPAACSFFIDAKGKPPFALKYAIAVKDAKKFNQVIGEAATMMNTGAFADFYKSLGMEVSLSVKRGFDDYKGVSIDAAKFVMKSTDPNSPQGQIINAMYGEGLDYRWAMVDGLCVAVMGRDVDSAVRELIDEVRAGGPGQMSGEVDAALALIPKASKADFVGTYNFLRVLGMFGAMMPVPMPQMDTATRGNIAFAGKVGDGKMAVEIALPKEHLAEIMAGLPAALGKSHDQAKQVASAANLRQVAVALVTYADEHDGEFPADLQQVTLYLGGAERANKILESPRKPTGFEGPSYIYIAGQSANTKAAADYIVVYENPELCGDKISALFLDFHVESMEPDRFLQKLKATYKRLGRGMPEIKFKNSAGPAR